MGVKRDSRFTASCKSCPWIIGDTYQRDCDFPYCSLAPGESAGYDPYNSLDTRKP